MCLKSILWTQLYFFIYCTVCTVHWSGSYIQGILEDSRKYRQNPRHLMLGHWYESTRRIISPTKRSLFPIDTGIRQYEVRQQQQQQQLPSQQQNFIYFAQIYVTFRMWLDGPSVPLCPTLSCVLPWRRPGVLLSYLWRGSQGPSLPLLQLPLSVIGITHTHHSWLLTQDIVLFRQIFIQLWGNKLFRTTP